MNDGILPSYYLLDPMKCRVVIGVLILRAGLKDTDINITQDEIYAVQGTDLCERVNNGVFQIRLENTMLTSTVQ